MWKQKLHAGQIDEDLYLAETKVLLQGLYSSMGDPARMSYTNTKLDTLQAMRRNVFTFVAFKNHHQIKDMVDLLTDDKGNLRPKADFIREARRISQDYNRNWLTAEYDTVVASGQTAAQWHDFQRNKELLPFLIYKTQEDSRVRDSHAVLHNVCKPIDDPFWDEYYPPNGWRCRCYVLQVAKQEGKEDPESEPSADEVKPIFRNNPGKSGIIFDDKHPYFAGMDYESSKKITTSMLGILSKDEDLYDIIHQSSNQKTLKMHATHVGHEREQNIATAKKIVDAGRSFNLLPIRRDSKNIDGLYVESNALCELKTIDGRWSVKNGIGDAFEKKSDLSHIVFDIVSDRPTRWSEVSSQLWQQFKRRHTLMEVVIWNGDQEYIVRREHLKEDFALLPRDK